MKNITISKEEYDRLIERDNWLNCLEAAGVDNWSGYDYAKEILNGSEDDYDSDSDAEDQEYLNEMREIEAKKKEEERIAEEKRIQREKYPMRRMDIIERVKKNLSKHGGFSKMDMIKEYVHIVESEKLESEEWITYWKTELSL